MKEELLSIGKMAKLNRVSIPTLRLYDEIGLLKPRYVDPDSGYRYYDIHQNARLDMIAYMKELGMSLSEIAEAFQKEDLDMIESLLVQKSEQIHEQMRQLKARHDAVDRAIMSIERYRKSPSTGTISLEFIDQRYIWGIPCSSNFYNSDISGYEKVLLKMNFDRFILIMSVLQLPKRILFMSALLLTKYLFSPIVMNKILMYIYK